MITDEFVKLNGIFVNKNAVEVLNLYHMIKYIQVLKKRLIPIYINGSGYLHHKTFDIIKEEKPERYIHVDAHSDCCEYNQAMTYHNFVNYIQDLDFINEVLFIGVKYQPNRKPKYKIISTQSDMSKRDSLKTHVSIDLDVVKEINIVENVWNSDAMLNLSELKSLLSKCRELYNISSLDICGIARRYEFVLAKPSLISEWYFRRHIKKINCLKDSMSMIEEIVQSLL